MSDIPNEKKLTAVLSLLMLGLLLRTTWICLIPNRQVADFATYDNIASALVRGEGYTNAQGRPSAFKPIGYPLFLSFVYRVFGESPFAAKVVQANLSTLLCLLIYIITRDLYGDARASVALTLAVLHPTFIFFSSLLGTELLFGCLFLASIAILFHFREKDGFPSWQYVALAGFIAGLGALVRPMALLLPIALFCAAFSSKRSFRRELVNLAIYSLALLAAVLPWTIRNYIHFNKFILISTNGGANLYYGNNPQGTIVWIPIDRLRRVQDFPEEKWADMSEPQRSACLQKMALRHILADPLGFFLRMPRKFYALMLSPEVPGVYWNVEGFDKDNRPSWSTVAFLGSLDRLFHYGLLVLAVLAAFSESTDDDRLMLLYYTLIVWTVFHLVYWGKARFRFALIPVFIILASGPIARISALLRRNRHA